jgi:uncharacterized protein YkwD
MRRRAAKRRERAQLRARRHRESRGTKSTPGGQTTARLPTATAPPESGAGPCEGADLLPSQHDVGLVATATLCLINRERDAHGEAPLSLNTDLVHAAQGHTESMAAQDYFEHVSPDGQTPLSRMQANGYLSGADGGYEIGENIAWGSLRESTPAAIVSAWMASPPHRANILNASFRDSGVGVSAALPTSFAGGEAGAIYTQDFGAVYGG